MFKYFKRFTTKGILFKIKEYYLILLNKIGLYSWQSAKIEWKKLPFDDYGYLDATDIIKFKEKEMADFVIKFEEQRYNINKWRNYKNQWRDNLGLDTTSNKLILDYGCGFGIESLQFAKNKNSVILADINLNNIIAATKILNAYNFHPIENILIRRGYPYYETSKKIDIFYSNGVLHHTPHIKEILTRTIKILNQDGEIRLLLYSDKMWSALTETLPPSPDFDIRKHNKYWDFVRGADLVGQYSDFYSEEKLKYRIGCNFIIESFEYICGPRNTKHGKSLEGCYCTVIIKAA